MLLESARDMSKNCKGSLSRERRGWGGEQSALHFEPNHLRRVICICFAHHWKSLTQDLDLCAVGAVITIGTGI